MPACVSLGVGTQKQIGGLEGGERFHLILKELLGVPRSQASFQVTEVYTWVITHA